MKRIILVISAILASVSLLSAQDIQTATDTYNQGAEALSNGDKSAALNYFQQALTMGEALGDEGSELVTNCKNAIPAVMLSLGKELYNNKDFDGALEKMGEAAKLAEEYGATDVADETASLIQSVTATKNFFEANDAFQAKDYATATEGFRKVLAADSTNASAALRLVQCLANTGDLDGAKDALTLAESNGQGDNAKKVLGGAYLKQARANLKAGKSAEAASAAVEATQYVDNAQAYRVAGQAYQKLGKNNEAIEYLTKYVEADPDGENANAISYTVAALYQKAGNKAKAKEFYQKVVNDAKLGASAKQQIEALSK